MHRILLKTLLLAGISVWGQTTPLTAQAPVRLAECVQYALDNNPQMKIANLQIADADWQIKENTATGLPQLSASIGYQYFIQRPGIPASALGFGTSDEKIAFSALHNLTPSISLNQLLFSNSYLTALKAARYYRQYVQQQLTVAQKTLRDQVTDAYLPALLIAENLKVLDKNIGNLEQLLRETTATTAAGFAEQLDVDRLQLALSSLRTERDNLARQRDVVVNALKMTMGMPVKQELNLADDLPTLLAGYTDTDIAAELNYTNRPEYVALLKGRELSMLQMDLYRKPWMPTVAAFVQYQPGWQGAFANDTKWYFIPSAVAGLSVSIPIWDGGGTRAKRERAIIAVQTVDAQKEMLENAFALEHENARKQFINATERTKSRQQNLDLAQRIYNTTQTKYKAGVGSSFELVSAEQQLFSAQQALMQAQYDLLAAKVALKKALGN
ncbi:MAG: TolC family protein [Lewinellaceae bacterium]|nr:TolC family protein [Lewinellaceae bacterium]